MGVTIGLEPGTQRVNEQAKKKFFFFLKLWNRGTWNRQMYIIIIINIETAHKGVN